MANLQYVLRERLQRSLASLTTAPSSWGSPESMELQTLLLLEVQAIVDADGNATETGLMATYEEFLATRFPGRSGDLLSETLRLRDRGGELPAMLADFAKQFAARRSVKESADLIIELEMTHGRASAPFSAICKYYDGLQASLRNIAKRVLPRWTEKGSTFIFRLSFDEKKAIEEAAESNGESASEFVRRVAIEAARALLSRA